MKRKIILFLFTSLAMLALAIVSVNLARYVGLESDVSAFERMREQTGASPIGLTSRGSSG